MNPLAFTKLSYGVYVVTSWADGGKPTGCTANSAMQVTAEPATIAVSINHSNFTNECIKNSGMFAINVLGENTAPLTIGTFGFRSGRTVDKFEGWEKYRRDNGLVFLPKYINENQDGRITQEYYGQKAYADVIYAGFR